MNKIRINNIFLVLLFILFTLSNITYAEERKDEWQNKEYDKENIKRILIKPVIISDGIKLEYFDEMRIREYCEQIKNNKKINEIGVKLLSEDDLLGKISGVVNEDLKEVAKSDPQRYQRIMDMNADKFIDQVLEYNLVSYGTEQIYVPEQWHEEIEYVETVVTTTKIDNKNNIREEKTVVQIPVKRLKVIPEHYKNIANTGFKTLLTDYKTKENIWMILDMRESEYKGLLPMSERICERIEDKFADFLKQKKPQK